MIDYALKPPNLNTELNIEKINISEKKEISNKDQNIFNKSYKYPFLASEILSRDYPFITDKIISANMFLPMTTNINNSGLLCGECSIINNSNNEDNLDDILEDNNISTIIKRESTLNGFFPFNNDTNVEENNSFNNSLEINNNEPSLELVDYIFNISFNNELNNVQGGYLVKIITSLIHSLYSPSKSLYFIKYICYKKANEILLKILNLIQYSYFRDIILEILLFSEEENRDNALEIIKGNILNYLINYLKYNGSGIRDLICQYIECNKNDDLILSENFLSKLITSFNNSNNEKVIENFCIINSYIIKSYKTEFNMNNNISTSKLYMSFKSPMKNNERSNYYFNSSVNLNFDEGNTLINKMTSFTKEINLNIVKSFSCIQSVLIFFTDIISLTRNNELLDNLKKINFFNFFSQKFFQKKNDIIQNILIRIINLMTEENADNWIINILIQNNFLKECLKYSNIPNNKNSKLFVHLSNLFELLVNNNYIKEVLTKNNLMQEVNKTYQKIYKDYCEKMKKPLGDFKNNSFCLGSILNKTIEGDNDFKKVDELDQGDNNLNSNKTIKTMIDNTRNNSFVKKNSSDIGNNIVNFENDIIENREDIDDDTTENKIIQIIPSMDDNND